MSDAAGRPASGVGVYFTTSGDGWVAGILRTNANGEVAIRWRPRTRPGTWVPLYAFVTDSAVSNGRRLATAYGTTRVGPPTQLVPVSSTVQPVPAVGDTIRIRLRLADADENLVLAAVPLTWTAAPPAAVVRAAPSTDADGIATADVAAGTTPGRRTVTAAAAFGTRDFAFEVVPGPVVSMTLAPTRLVFFQSGETVPLAVSAADRFGNVLSTAGTLAIRGTDTSVVGVGYTNVTSRGPGDATVTASVGPISRTVRVTVRTVVDAAGACVQLGDGAAYCRAQSSALPSADPAPVTDTLAGYRALTDDAGRPLTVVRLARGGRCAQTTGGALWCWDVLPSVLGSTAPIVRVAEGRSYAEFDAGFTHGCGLLADGRAECWGNGSLGALGTRTAPGCVGSPICSPTPVAVEGGRTFTAIAAQGSDHTCALDPDGAAWCWGSNGAGQLGTSTPDSTCGPAGSTFGCAYTPVPVNTDQRFRAVAAGPYTSCGLTAAGEAWCWPAGSGGGPTPRRVLNTYLLKEIAMSTGGDLCGLTTAGDVVCASAMMGLGTPTVVIAGRQLSGLTVGLRARVCGRTSRGELVCAGASRAFNI